MTHKELLERISIDPAVCGGKPCIRGHRIAYGSEMTRERTVHTA